MKKLSLKKILKESRDDLQQFAKMVLSSARPGIFPDKAFISEIWKSNFQNMPLEKFKSMLLAAHKAGNLVLSRADMTNVLPQDLVRESEISVGNATFHFVKFDASQNPKFAEAPETMAHRDEQMNELFSDIDSLIQLAQILKQKIESNQKFSFRGIRILKTKIERIENLLKNGQHLE